MIEELEDTVFTELEERVMDKVQYDMFHTDSLDTVSKLYRQARLWVRFHWHYEEACDKAHAELLNLEFKKMHKIAKERIKLFKEEL